MLKKLLITLLALIGVLVVAGLFLPTELAIAREITIDADPKKVDAYVSDLERWGDWMAWKEDDPSIVVSYGDKTKGLGATQSWTGMEGESTGTVTVTKADDTGIAYDMTIDTMPSKSEIQYEVVDGKTKVIWKMDSDFDVPIVGGYFRMMFKGSLEDWFDRGLAKLKKQVEQK